MLAISHLDGHSVGGQQPTVQSMVSIELRSHLRVVGDALAFADYAIANGGIMCQGQRIEHDIKEFREWSQAIESFSSSSASTKSTDVETENIVDCLRCITDYALFVGLLATKTTVMQVLYQTELVDRSKRSYSAASRIRNVIDRAPAGETKRYQQLPVRVEELESLIASADFHQLSNQLEPLAFITKLEQEGWKLDAVAQTVKDEILACAVDYVKTTTRTLPEWYMSECDCVFTGCNTTTGAIEVVVRESSQAVELRYNFVSRGWDDPYEKVTPQEQFAISISMWKSLCHENLCSVVSANQFSLPDAMVATEFCAFGSLDSFLSLTSGDRQRRAVEMLLQAAKGVCYLHSIDFVHGDLRCASIRITRDQSAKVSGPTDYLAWFEKHSGIQMPNKAPDPSADDVTRWLAPECVTGETGLTQASDVYAFGMTIYEAITGTLPFSDLDDRSVRERKLQHDSRLSLRGLYKLDNEVRAIIESACQLNPAKRPTMQQVLERLQGVGKEKNAQAAMTSNTSQSAHSSLQPAPAAEKPSSLLNLFQPATAVVTPLPAPGLDTSKLPLGKPHATSKVAPLSDSITPGSTVQLPANGGLIPLISSALRWVKAGVAMLVLVLVVVIVVMVLMTKKSSNGSMITTLPATTNVFTPAPTTPLPTTLPPPTPAPTPAPTPPPTTRAPSSVSTFASGFTTEPVTSIAVANDNSVYVSDAYQVFRMAETYPYPAPFAGTRTRGSTNAFRINAQFSNILGLAVDTYGNVVVADADNYLIRSVSTSGQVSTLAGDGSSASINGPALSASMGKPYDVATDASNNVYVADFYGDDIRKVWTSTARVSSLGGKVEWPRALAVTPSGTVYVASRHGILGVSSDGSSTWTVAGSVSSAGFLTGTGASARFDTIRGLALSPAGDELYVADTNNHCIRKVNVNTFVVTTIAGECQWSGSVDGGALSARFIRPMGIAVGANGVIYVVDGGASSPRVRKLVL